MPLPDGSAARFPNGTPQAEIERAAAYIDATAPAPMAAAPEPSPESLPAPVNTDQIPGLEFPAVAPAGLPAILPGAYRFRLGPYVPDDDRTGVDEFIAQLPEVVPAGWVCREVLERSRLPPGRSIDPPGEDNPFRDNDHRCWSRRYWRP